jgi:cyclin-dependent kinase 7
VNLTAALLEMPGTSFDGSRIEKGKKIGEGTYAVVYAGSMTVLETNEKILVAIKKIKAGAYKDGLDLSAIREIKALKEMQHENVVKLYQVFTKKFNLNLVLEFLETDLESIIKQKSVSFGSADIKSWMLMAMRGLYHIHSLFVLHRVF